MQEIFNKIELLEKLRDEFAIYNNLLNAFDSHGQLEVSFYHSPRNEVRFKIQNEDGVWAVMTDYYKSEKERLLREMGELLK
jgi:hypothetical protein